MIIKVTYLNVHERTYQHYIVLSEQQSCMQSHATDTYLKEANILQKWPRYIPNTELSQRNAFTRCWLNMVRYRMCRASQLWETQVSVVCFCIL